MKTFLKILNFGISIEFLDYISIFVQVYGLFSKIHCFGIHEIAKGSIQKPVCSVTFRACHVNDSWRMRRSVWQEGENDLFRQSELFQAFLNISSLSKSLVQNAVLKWFLYLPTHRSTWLEMTQKGVLFIAKTCRQTHQYVRVRKLRFDIYIFFGLTLVAETQIILKERAVSFQLKQHLNAIDVLCYEEIVKNPNIYLDECNNMVG